MTLNVDRLVRIQDEATIAWHRREAVSAARNPLEAIVLEQHRANYDLWHQEDGARDPEAADATIADVKHAIDRINQRRNDLVEQMDALLLEAAGPQVEDAPLHSETPGMIVDRLSILELKVYHTALEVHRETATDAHRARNAARLAVLEGQRVDPRRLPRCPVVGRARRPSSRQALSPDEDVQRPRVEPRFVRQAQPLAARHPTAKPLGS